MRVNARLDGDYERQMEFLIQTTGMGVSDVIKASVERYYHSLRGAEKPRLSHLRAAAGKFGSGRKDVASNTKVMLDEGLRRKHGGVPE